MHLLDVNVLIALFDPDHIHHQAAHDWFADHRVAGWATCPMTENGLIRVLSNPAYGDIGEHPAGVADRLRRFKQSGHHVFWTDDVSLTHEGVLRADYVLTARLVPDVYLLTLAVRHGGRLATFDRTIPTNAVLHAMPEHLSVIEA